MKVYKNETEGWKFPTGSCKGLTIWFLRGGGVETAWVISEKNILHTDLEGKKFLQENTWQNNPTLKKIPFMELCWKKSYTIVRQEKNFSPEVWGKIFLPPTKSGKEILHNRPSSSFISLCVTANFTGYRRLLGEETSRNHQAYREATSTSQYYKK